MVKGNDSQPFWPAGEAFARSDRLAERLSRGEGAGLSVLVVGAGKSGRAAARLLLSKGVAVTVADDGEAARAAAQADLPEVATCALDEAACEAADLVVLSPGVPRRLPALARSIRIGKLVGEVELASWFVRVPMVGITGTNGKSTTTALVAHMLEQASPGRIFAGGNLGRPLSELAMDPGSADAAVVELSSYQLESIVQAKFRVACWLNLTPDHTDRYEDMRAYAAAKRRLIERRTIDGVAVLNAKDRWCAQTGIGMGGPVRWFSVASSELAHNAGTRMIDASTAERVFEGGTETFRLDNPALIGQHNQANALAAIECARMMGASAEAVQAGLSTFAGLPHRLELVAELDGVQWRNDSKATNVDSALTALLALARPVLLIAGGKDKGAPWAPLVEAAKGRVKQVLAIGEAEGVVAEAFEGSGIEVVRAQTLERAVELAREAAAPGDVVLLSPACASFDQFDNFEVRGDRFKALVRGQTA